MKIGSVSKNKTIRSGETQLCLSAKKETDYSLTKPKYYFLFRLIVPVSTSDRFSVLVCFKIETTGK